jgi:hypothetical protein
MKVSVARTSLTVVEMAERILAEMVQNARGRNLKHIRGEYFNKDGCCAVGALAFSAPVDDLRRIAYAEDRLAASRLGSMSVIRGSDDAEATGSDYLGYDIGAAYRDIMIEEA